MNTSGWTNPTAERHLGPRTVTVPTVDISQRISVATVRISPSTDAK